MFFLDHLVALLVGKTQTRQEKSQLMTGVLVKKDHLDCWKPAQSFEWSRPIGRYNLIRMTLWPTEQEVSETQCRAGVNLHLDQLRSGPDLTFIVTTRSQLCPLCTW